MFTHTHKVAIFNNPVHLREFRIINWSFIFIVYYKIPPLTVERDIFVEFVSATNFIFIHYYKLVIGYILALTFVFDRKIIALKKAVGSMLLCVEQ